VTVTVRDNPPENRYEIHDGEQLAGFSTYKLTSGTIAFLHTEIDPAFRGRGMAGQLIRAALDDVRRRGLAVLPYCPYVREFIARHADGYLDLVPLDRRERFNLTQTTG
jgi:uncharacterized protein